MLKELLPDFQKFLVSRKLVSEKYVSYYAGWASKFLTFSNDHENLRHELRIEEFLNKLRANKNIADWQIKQADEALKLYICHFLEADKSALYPNSPQTNRKYPEVSKVISEIRKAIRIKHYAYSTEHTYIDWVKRFYHYVLNEKKKDISSHALDTNDVKDYLSYLALKKRVSASTQNQAFNSLLFLFREVLKTDPGNLNKTVRAKRGVRLPVVLSPEKIQEIFRYAEGKNLLILQLLYGAGLRLMELARIKG